MEEVGCSDDLFCEEKGLQRGTRSYGSPGHFYPAPIDDRKETEVQDVIWHHPNLFLRPVSLHGLKKIIKNSHNIQRKTNDPPQSKIPLLYSHSQPADERRFCAETLNRNEKDK